MAALHLEATPYAVARSYTTLLDTTHAFAAAAAELGAVQKFIKPRCPWTNGKVERFNRTLAREWAYRRPYTSNHARTLALDDWIEYYNTRRPHTACRGRAPTTRLSPT